MPTKDKHKKSMQAVRYRAKHGDALRTYTRTFQRTRAQALAEIKLERGCATCGYRGHPHALHFDHLPGTEKRGNVSNMWQATWAEVLKEIEKCQVLCANCHAIATAERRMAAREAKRQARDKDQLRLHLA